MTPTVRISTAGLKAAFARFSAVDQKAILDKTVRTDAMGFVRDIIAITPPGHQGKPLVSGAKGEPAVAGARLKIKKDLKRIFNPLADAIVDRALAEDSGAADGVKLWVSKTGRVYGQQRTLWRPNATIETCYDHHRRYFKNGRMTKAGTYTRDIGRWKFIDRMVIRESLWLEYLEYVWEKIGILAGGFAAAAKMLKVRLPKIAARHASGECLLIYGPDSFKIRIKNGVSYATEADVERRARHVLDSDKRAKRLGIRIKEEIRAKLKAQLART
jgi:hypothetical protein